MTICFCLPGCLSLGDRPDAKNRFRLNEKDAKMHAQSLSLNRLIRRAPRSLLLAGLALAFALPAHAAVGEGIFVANRDESGAPVFMEGDLGAVDPNGNWTDETIQFMKGFATRQLDASGDLEFRVVRVFSDGLGFMHVRVQQVLNGLPVDGGDLTLHADARTGRVTGMMGRMASDGGLPTTATLTPDAALDAASNAADLTGETRGEPELVYVVSPQGAIHLAWRSRISYQNEQGPQVDHVYADATTGALVARHPKIHYAGPRSTFNAENKFELPGRLSCRNEQVCADPILQNVHTHTGQVYDYFLNRFSRRSFDGQDAEIRATGHYGSRLSRETDNAFYDVEFKILGFGDGIRVFSSPLGNGYDVVAHEFQHAVTEAASGLIYAGESGGLNESLSDIFAAGAEAFRDGVSADTFKIGEDVFKPIGSLDALRYMDDPARDGASLDFFPDYRPGVDVHFSSGISNLAFYKLVFGGTHPRGKTTVNVRGTGLQLAEEIFYRAVGAGYFTPNTNFAGARAATARAARELYDASYGHRVETAWCSVGVGSCPAAIDKEAEFVRQAVPSSMAPGSTADVTIVMRNAGTATWTAANQYKLGSRNPQDNTTFGLSRVPVSGSVAPGQEATFTFRITAPTTPGTYFFQWRMLREGDTYFGSFSSNVPIRVQ